MTSSRLHSAAVAARLDMAYCQSQLYVQFMQEKFGPQTKTRVASGLCRRLENRRGHRQGLQSGQAAFEKDYRAYLDKSSVDTRQPAVKPMTLTEIRTRMIKTRTMRIHRQTGRAVFSSPADSRGS